VALWSELDFLLWKSNLENGANAIETLLKNYARSSLPFSDLFSQLNAAHGFGGLLLSLACWHRGQWENSISQLGLKTGPGLFFNAVNLLFCSKMA
jgi:hypothetical protein